MYTSTKPWLQYCIATKNHRDTPVHLETFAAYQLPIPLNPNFLLSRSSALKRFTKMPPKKKQQTTTVERILDQYPEFFRKTSGFSDKQSLFKKVVEEENW